GQNPLGGACFTVDQGDQVCDDQNGDGDNNPGSILIENVAPGQHQVVESQAPDGYQPAADPQTVDVPAGGTGEATFVNTAVATETPTESPTETPTETATETPTEAATSTETPTEAPAATETATETAAPTDTPTVESSPTVEAQTGGLHIVKQGENNAPLGG